MRRVLALCLPGLLLAAGCATKAYVDFDPEARFDRFRTWAWLQDEARTSEEAAGGADPLLLRRIRTTIANGLVAKGYSQVDDPASADFAVSFSVGAREKLEQSQVSVGTGWGGRYGGWYATAPVAAQSYTEGTLAIDVFDVRSQQAVWHGRASRRVTPSMDREELVNDVVGAILAKFPPER